MPILQHAFAIFDRLRTNGNISIRNNPASPNKTIFSKMADSGEKLQFSEDTISQEACNLAIPSTDTTAIALTYLAWAMLRHPEVQAKLQAD
jgi:cytochrome P450